MENLNYVNILIRRKKIEWIAHNYRFSNHAIQQTIKRDIKDDFDFKERILYSPLCWKTKDDCIAIALDLFNYIVVNADTKDEQGNNFANIVTFINTKQNDRTIIDEMLIDYKRQCLGVNNYNNKNTYYVVRANSFWYKFDDLEKAEEHYNYIYENLNKKYKNINILYLAEYCDKKQDIIKIWNREDL